MSPPYSGLASTISPLLMGGRAYACTPRSSWLMAMSSRLSTISSISGISLRTSCPSSSGAESMHHSEKCALYSFTVHPPPIWPTYPSPLRPTTIISGSFHAPWPAIGPISMAFLATVTIDSQLSLISPDSRHMLAPAVFIHSVTVLRPRQPDKMMSLPLSRSACPILRNR